MNFSLAAGSKAKACRRFPAFDFPDFTLSYGVSRWEKLLRRLVFVFPKQNAKFSPMRGVTVTVKQGSCGKRSLQQLFSSSEEVQE